MPRLLKFAAAGSALTIGSVVFAQTPTPLPTNDADALRGPSVKDRTVASTTLVERGPDGKIRRLDLDPALAALEKLTLDDQTRAKVDRIVVARLAVLDKIVKDNFIAIAELSQANQAGDKKAARKLLAELYVKARPYLDRGGLVGELRPALPTEAHQKLKAMVDEYTQACISERMAGVDDNGNPHNRISAGLAENLGILGQEVRRSYERSIQSGGDELDKLIKDLRLTPEQESKVRTRVQDVYLNTKGKPTQLQVARVFLHSYQDLDTEQRQHLIRIINQKREAQRPLRAPKLGPTPDTPAKP